MLPPMTNAVRILRLYPEEVAGALHIDATVDVQDVPGDEARFVAH